MYLKETFHLDISRNWKEIEYFDDAWKIRIDRMANYIDKDVKTVMDLGCGKCWLKDILPMGIHYIGVDYTPRNCADVIVCDFNSGEFPSMLADVVFCSGVLEYVEDLPAFVQNICQITDRVILSYCVTDCLADLRTRNSLGWKNHFSSLEIINMFLSKGFSLKRIDSEVEGNPIFVMHRFIDSEIINYQDGKDSNL